MRGDSIASVLMASWLGACVQAQGETKSVDSAGDSATDTGDTSPGTGWTAVEADAAREACGLTADGQVLCWGERPQEEAPPAAGGWTQLSLFGKVGCVGDVVGVVECWWNQHNDGADQHLRQPPDEPLHKISVGAWLACGFNDDAELSCWGEQSDDWTPPEGSWKAVDVGGDVACAIGVGGGLECWGFKTYHDHSVNYASVSSGFDHFVALDERGVAHCVAGGYLDTCDVPDGVHFRMVDAGNEATCGITTDGDLLCWASQSGWYESFDVGPKGLEPGPWVDVAVGGAGACAVRETGEMVCFVGEGGYLSNIPDPG